MRANGGCPLLLQFTDERILGDGDFVEDVLSAAQEQMEKSYRLVAKGYDLDKIASKISDLMQIKPSEIWALEMLSTVSELDWKYMQKWATILGIDDLLRKAKENE